MNKTEKVSDGATMIMSTASSPDEVGAGEFLTSLPLKPQDRYKFIRSIGFGGMKGVLLVHDRDTDRDIAMAIMPDFRDRSTSELARFAGEALLTAKLEHPNVVPIYDIGIDDTGSPFFTMKYLRGYSLETLLQRLRKGDSRENQEYSLQRLLLIFHRVCNAVGFAHTKGICHLDLKPANVNVSDFGETFVIDWGLAHKVNEKEGVTSEQLGVCGTPGFMPPEQFDVRTGLPLDARSDIFALGALLYAMLGLTPPFSGKTSEEILYKTMTEEPPRLSQVAPKGSYIPPELEAICRKAMAKDPADRFASVAEMRLEVMNFQSRSYQHSFMRRHKSNQLSHIILFLFIVIAILIFYLKNF
jgi:serine/threonine-protein kinase